MATRKNNNKIIDNSRECNIIIEEERKRIIEQNNLVEELNYFNDKVMPFDKYKGKPFKGLYFENYNYCL